MGDGPRYAPRSQYRTRSSGAEIESIEDHAVTALDRPAVDLEQARRDRDAGRTAAIPSRTPLGVIVGGAIVILILLGVCVGAVLAVVAE